MTDNSLLFYFLLSAKLEEPIAVSYDFLLANFTPELVADALNKKCCLTIYNRSRIFHMMVTEKFIDQHPFPKPDIYL